MLSLENNKVATIEEVLALKFLKEMNYLDLTENPVTKLEGYRDKVFEAMPNLIALDGKDKDGESVMVDDEDDDYGEEGEFEMENIEEKLKALDPELRKKYDEGNMDVDEMRALGLIPDFMVDFDEGGEDEIDENGEEATLGKREREDGDEKNEGKKEQKTEEPKE